METDVAQFQKQFCELVNQIDDRTCELVAKSKVSDVQQSKISTNYCLQSSQATLTSMKDNWLWLRDLASCLDNHIENASNYHLFYQTLREYRHLMGLITTQARSNFTQECLGEYEEAKYFFDSIQELLTIFLQWWQRVDALILQSRKILPISLRRQAVDFKRPAKMLTSYKSESISLREKEDVFVCNSKDRCTWQIENLRGDVADVPSLCVLLTGPETEAVEKAVLLRADLLQSWTGTLKELGKNLIGYIMAVFRQWNTREAEALSPEVIQLESKVEILQLLHVIENMLQSCWADNPEFEELHERICSVRAALSIYSDEDVVDDATQIDINTIFLQMSPIVLNQKEGTCGESDNQSANFVVQKRVLNLLLKKYQEFSKYWEVYKVLVGTSNDPSYFWMIEEFQKLKNVNIVELFNFITTEDKNVWSSYLKLLLHADTPKTSGHEDQQLDGLQNLSKTRSYGEFPLGGFNPHPELTPSSMARVNSSKFSAGSMGSGVNSLFSKLDSQPEYRSVSQENLSYRTSVEAGSEQWQYTTYNAVVNEHQPVLAAAAAASCADADEEDVFLQSATSSTRAMTRSVSETAVNTQRREVNTARKEMQQHLLISGVRDALTDQVYGLQNAIQIGLVNQTRGTYFNKKSFQEVPIPSAISEGFIQVEAETREESPEETENYGIITVSSSPLSRNFRCKVHSVHDSKRGTRLSVEDAVRTGVADKQLRSVVDTATGRRLSFEEAVESGLVQLDKSDFTQLEACSQSQTSGDSAMFLVSSVVDVFSKEKLSFKEAVDRGVLDIEQGFFVDTMTTEHLDFEDAIRRGLLNVEPVKSV